MQTKPETTPAPEEWDDDPRAWDDEDGDDDFDCHLMPDGQCLAAGSEDCDFACPMRNSEFYAGSAAWNRKHGVK